MSSHNVITIEPYIGRRREARLRLWLAVRLILRDGSAQAVLASLSHGGARLAGTAALLRPGNEALLCWDGHEAFGQVVWAADGQFGLSFYEPIGRKALIQTRMMDDGTRRRGVDDAVRAAAQAFVSGKRSV